MDMRFAINEYTLHTSCYVKKHYISHYPSIYNVNYSLFETIPYIIWTIRLSSICAMRYSLFMNIHYTLLIIHDRQKRQTGVNRPTDIQINTDMQTLRIFYSLFTNRHYTFFSIHEETLYIIYHSLIDTTHIFHSWEDTIHYLPFMNIHYLPLVNIHYSLFTSI